MAGERKSNAGYALAVREAVSLRCFRA